MGITIYTNGHISIDGRSTGLAVSQGKDGTEVYTIEGFGKKYQRHSMPHKRYALSSDAGSGKNPGRDQFENDFMALLERLN